MNEHGETAAVLIDHCDSLSHATPYGKKMHHVGAHPMTAPAGNNVGPDDLKTLGWNEKFEKSFRFYANQGLRPARVGVAHNYLYQLYSTKGEVMAEVAGKLRHQITQADALPVVGDWVAIRFDSASSRATIEAVLPRRSHFARRAAGEPTRKQLVAANIDTVFLVCGLDDDFNLRRIERYLVAIRTSGATAVVVLNKADLCANPEPPRAAASALAPELSIHVIHSLAPSGTDPLLAHLAPGHTCALIGSSGVGKSTIINRLLGTDRQRTRAVRTRDGRGRHTTTQRELILIPGHGMLIDTPGMRELQLWDEVTAIDDAFDDVRNLAVECRFRDCAHNKEPGCAVRSAVETGHLKLARLNSYLQLQREGQILQERQAALVRLEEQRKVKTVHRAMRTSRNNRLTDDK